MTQPHNQRCKYHHIIFLLKKPIGYRNNNELVCYIYQITNGSFVNKVFPLGKSQAWSNDEYKSVEHKVVANDKVERYSIAYFLCPSYTTMISGCKEPSIYRKFTFEEYRHQIQEDVKKIGHKIGLSKFLRKDAYTTIV